MALLESGTHCHVEGGEMMHNGMFRICRFVSSCAFLHALVRTRYALPIVFLCTVRYTRYNIISPFMIQSSPVHIHPSQDCFLSVPQLSLYLSIYLFRLRLSLHRSSYTVLYPTSPLSAAIATSYFTALFDLGQPTGQLRDLPRT